jgi:hypothetical protein
MNPQDVILPLHILVLTFVAWTVISADHMGFDWIRGKVRHLDEVKVRKLHRDTWLGLCGMILTGAFLFWPAHNYILTYSLLPFVIKMSCVTALIINGFAIGRLQKVALTKSFAELTKGEKLPLIISGAVSTIGWLGAAAMAFFLLP